MEWTKDKLKTEGQYLFVDNWTPMLVTVKNKDGILTMIRHPNTYSYPVSILNGDWMGPIVVEELRYKRIFCKDCVNICKPAGALYMPHPESVCLDGGILNYVTGEVEPFLCKNKNNDGHCSSYDPKNKAEFPWTISMA